MTDISVTDPPENLVRRYSNKFIIILKFPNQIVYQNKQ